MLRMQEDEDESPGQADVPADSKAAAGAALSGQDAGAASRKSSTASDAAPEKRSLSKLAKGAIFREIVLAKVREMKESEKQLQVEKEAQDNAAKRKSTSR